MKKYMTTLLALAALCFTACDDAQETTFSELAFYPAEPIALYADQTEDSTKIVSTHSWTVTTEAAWAGFNSDLTNKGVQGKGGRITTRALFFAPNTTGLIRDAVIRLSGDGKQAQTIARQVYWLDVRTPGVSFPPTNDGNSDNVNEIFKGAQFIQTLGAGATETQLCFVVHSDDATLKTDADWVKLDGVQIKRGRNDLKLELEPNTTGTARMAVLHLTSRGITTDIQLIQGK